MAFDMGFDFRGTAGFVTDDAHYGVPVIAEAFPHTYTNGDGQSINGGYTATLPTPFDRSNTNDPRIAGINYTANNAQCNFQVDLSSGSAPGAGSYTIDAAVGDQGSLQPQDAVLKDNTTALITFNATTAAGHFLDATTTDITASTTWTGTTVSKTFSSTTCNFVIGGTAGVNFTTIAHFRLTLQAGGAAVSTLRSLMLLGVGA